MMRPITLVYLMTTVLLASFGPAVASGRSPLPGLPAPRVRVSKPGETCYQLVDRAWPGASFRLLKDESDPLGDHNFFIVRPRGATADLKVTVDIVYNRRVSKTASLVDRRQGARFRITRIKRVQP
jgi:hypothetical protein